MSKIGIIGDMHEKPFLTYADYIEDRREGERNEIYDFIVDSFKDCDAVVFMGDLLNGRNNQSEVIRRLVSFIERFSGKEIFIIGGNHEISADGSSALDFLNEVKNPKWHVYTNLIGILGGIVFCPYFKNPMLGVENNDEGRKKLMEILPDGKILFAHHAFSGSVTDSGTNTDAFNEIVLHRKDLKKKYKLSIGGHIHSPQREEGIVVTGSIFRNEMNEKPKKIWIVDSDTLCVSDIPLPGRNLQKIENPSVDDLMKLAPASIIKAILTDPELKDKEEDIKNTLRRFDAFILLEQFPNERKKIVSDNNLLDFSVEEMLDVYAKQKKIDPQKLIEAYNLIK